MSDILADYRAWRAQQEDRIGTHSPECHLHHEHCMIHRLARELERTRDALLAVAMHDGKIAVSDGMLFVDVKGREELAFDVDRSIRR